MKKICVVEGFRMNVLNFVSRRILFYTWKKKASGITDGAGEGEHPSEKFQD